MRLLWLLSALSAFRGRGSGAMMLNAVQLPPAPMGGASVHSPAYQGRRRRSWVWNQFFVLEEFTGDEPLYVGKVGGARVCPLFHPSFPSSSRTRPSSSF